VQEDKGKLHSHQKLIKKRFIIWGHFTTIEGEMKPTAACNYCGTTYACDSKLNGTIAMRTHIESQCLKYPFGKVKNNQLTLAFKPKEEGEISRRLVPHVYNFEACKKTLAEMIILDELSFRFVEGLGLRRFRSAAQPRFHPIPCHITMAKACFRVFLDENYKLKEALREQWVCLTTNTWTSVQNLNYMCLTVHFIDSDWKMHKRILSFRLVKITRVKHLERRLRYVCLIGGYTRF